MAHGHDSHPPPRPRPRPRPNQDEQGFHSAFNIGYIYIKAAATEFVQVPLPPTKEP